MADDPTPPRRTYAFKPRDFERANPRPAAEAGGGVPAPAATSGRINVRDLCRQASRPRGETSPPAPGRTPTTNEIHTLLRLNADRADATGLNDLAPLPRRPSRRRRDYWICLLGGWTLLALAVVVSGLNPVSVVYSFAGAVLLGVGLTWVFWCVMDDY